MQRSARLDQYSRFVNQGLLSRIYQMANDFKGLRVLHVNTTLEGGGVAEILQSFLPIMQEIGINHTWEVINLDTDSQYFAAYLLDLLQGGEKGVVDREQQGIYSERLLQVAKDLQYKKADIYFIHDFQLAPLAKLFPWMRPAVWFCHIDTGNSNQDAEHYLMQFLDAYDLCVFSYSASVFKSISTERTKIVTLGIDNFRLKNRFLTKSKAISLLSHCGIDSNRPLITQGLLKNK